MKDIEFETLNDLHKHLIENKRMIMLERKSAVKYADAVGLCSVDFADKDLAVKSESSSEVVDAGTIRVKVVINTTNIIDSHRDCHIPNLWKKSISEQRKTKLLKEHKASFENIISDNVVPTTKNMSWKDLGLGFDGTTQALIFDAEIKEDRNPYMFEQYKRGYVDNHSVGMKYVNYVMCVNSEEKWAAEEKSNWDKYYPEVVNKEIADEYGYFYAVLEAKIIEGSAVVYGSNYATPTLSVKSNEPKATQDIEPVATPEVIESDFSEIKNLFKNSLNLN